MLSAVGVDYILWDGTDVVNIECEWTGEKVIT
jgi:hypothetical protein